MSNTDTKPDEPVLKWVPIQDLTITGLGWGPERCKHPLDRLPAEAETQATEAVWGLCQRQAGVAVEFHADPSQIHIRATFRGEVAEAHRYGKWADLYARDTANGGAWRWAGVPNVGAYPSGQGVIRAAMPRIDRHWRLYLPYGISVDTLEIGVDPDTSIRPAAVDARPPIAYYGTSIVHGASAARPGMTHSAILGRRLDYPILNLGFSGSARCEPPLGAIIGQLDPAFFIVDPLPNMNLQNILDNGEAFLRAILNQRPQTPILMVEDRTHTQDWIYGENEARANKRKSWREIHDRLAAEYPGRFYYLEGEHLLNQDWDATTDGSHPNELGFTHYANKMEPTLRHILATVATS